MLSFPCIKKKNNQPRLQAPPPIQRAPYAQQKRKGVSAILGHGTFGVVTSCGTNQVKKESNPPSMLTQEQVRETIILASLRHHPHVVEFVCVDRNERKEYALRMVRMDLNMFDYVQLVRSSQDDANSLPAPEFWLPYMEQMLKGIAALHDKGFVHGDIKMDNFLIDEKTLHVRICDFGLSRTWLFKGSGSAFAYVYRAPELFLPPADLGEVALHTLSGPEVDIFAFGVLMVMLCGENVFKVLDNPWDQLERTLALLDHGDTKRDWVNKAKAYSAFEEAARDDENDKTKFAALARGENLQNFDEALVKSNSKPFPPSIVGAIKLCLQVDPDKRAQCARGIARTLGVSVEPIDELHESKDERESGEEDEPNDEEPLTKRVKTCDSTPNSPLCPTLVSMRIVSNLSLVNKTNREALLNSAMWTLVALLRNTQPLHDEMVVFAFKAARWFVLAARDDGKPLPTSKHIAIGAYVLSANLTISNERRLPNTAILSLLTIHCDNPDLFVLTCLDIVFGTTHPFLLQDATMPDNVSDWVAIELATDKLTTETECERHKTAKQVRVDGIKQLWAWKTFERVLRANYVVPPPPLQAPPSLKKNSDVELVVGVDGDFDLDLLPRCRPAVCTSS